MSRTVSTAPSVTKPSSTPAQKSAPASAAAIAKKRARRPRPPLTVPLEGDGLLSSRQAEAALQIGRTTLWRWAGEGRLHPVRFGRMTRFRISEIRALLESAA